jgi:two-component system, LuxR family, sensor kinase FixL
MSSPVACARSDKFRHSRAGAALLSNIREIGASRPRATAHGVPGAALIASAPRLLLGATFLVVYLSLEWVSFIHEYKGVPVTPWNPGLGAVFALMLFAGARYSIVLFVGVVIAEIAVLRSSLSWPVIIGIASIIAIGYAGMTVIARRVLAFDAGLGSLRDVLLLLIGGGLGATIVAVLVSLLLVADAQLDIADLPFAALPLLVGDLIGIAVVTPLMLRLVLHTPHLSVRALRALAPEVVLYVALVTLLLWLILGTESAAGFKYFYLFFLPVVVAAVRHGLDGACLGLALTQLGLVGLLRHHGYDANVFTEFQVLMLILTATGLTVGVVVTERRQAARAMREVEARLRAKELEAAQAARFTLVSGMASALAHEINQPMTAARALARAIQELMRAPNIDHARTDGNLTNLVAQIDHAAGVVRRMRDFLRRGHPHVSTIDALSMLDDALILVRAEARAKAIEIVLDVPAALPPLHGDRIQLQQVILNLVRNAMEALAGHTDGTVRIGVRRFDDRVELSVADNGPGIEAALAARLFEPLTTSKPDGLGLGLSICASIVQLHGGRIWLHSGATGATEFRFSLPLQPKPS